MPQAAEAMAPLADLLADHPLQKKLSISLEGPALAAFEETKQSLSTKTWLAHFDPHAPIFLKSGASAVDIGGSLNQTINGKAVPLGFYAKMMSLTQQRYSTFCRELLAIHCAIQHFRHLLEGRDFYVLTDHLPSGCVHPKMSVGPPAITTESTALPHVIAEHLASSPSLSDPAATQKLLSRCLICPLVILVATSLPDGLLMSMSDNHHLPVDDSVITSYLFGTPDPTASTSRSTGHACGRRVAR